jgi:hypothetical protein
VRCRAQLRALRGSHNTRADRRDRGTAGLTQTVPYDASYTQLWRAGIALPWPSQPGWSSSSRDSTLRRRSRVALSQRRHARLRVKGNREGGDIRDWCFPHRRIEESAERYAKRRHAHGDATKTIRSDGCRRDLRRAPPKAERRFPACARGRSARSARQSRCPLGASARNTWPVKSGSCRSGEGR